MATEQLRASRPDADVPPAGRPNAPQGSIRREIVLDAPASSVWKAISTPDEIAAWFGAEAEIDLRTGGAVRFTWPDGSERRGVVVDVEPGRRFSWRWRTAFGATDVSTVQFELEPDGAAIRLTVTEAPGVLASGSAHEPGR